MIRQMLGQERGQGYPSEQPHTCGCFGLYRLYSSISLSGTLPHHNIVNQSLGAYACCINISLYMHATGAQARNARPVYLMILNADAVQTPKIKKKPFLILSEIKIMSAHKKHT